MSWSSSSQVAKLLRERGHDVRRTDEATLLALTETEPLVPMLLRYREACKRASTYGIEWLRKHLHPAARAGACRLPAAWRGGRADVVHLA